VRKLILSLLAAGALAPSPCQAHGIPHNEAQVNAWTTGDQKGPRLARTEHGDVFFVWESDDQDLSGPGIFGSLGDHFGLPIRSEFQVNSFTSGAQTSPDVARNGLDDFMVVWSGAYLDGDDSGIAARLFDPSGQEVGGEIIVNSWTTAAQSTPSVAALAAGGFVVAWSDEGGADGSGAGIRARLLDANGTSLGGEFQVNSYTTGDQVSPSTAGDGLGGFVVAWSGSGPDDTGGVFARRFDSGGSPLGPELGVNDFTTGSQLLPRVGVDGAGAFTIVWSGPGEGDGDGGISIKNFDSAGQPIGQETLVNSFTSGSQSSPSIGTGDGGEFMVAWQSEIVDGSALGISAQIFDPTGLRMRGNFLVNTWTTGNQAAPSVAVDPNGFVLAWQSDGQDGSGYGVFQRPYPPPGLCLSGDADGDEVCQDNDNCPGTANTGQEDFDADLVGEACDVSITAPLQGDLLDCTDPRNSRPTVAWDPGDYDRFKVFLSSSSLFGKRLRVSSGDWKAITDWTPSTSKWKNACALAASADPQNPVIFIRVEGKDTDLGKGDLLRESFSAVVDVDVAP